MLIQITSKCNEMCKHCMVSATPDGLDSTMEQVDDLCKYLRLSMPIVVVISGGEITCSNQWFEKISKIIETVQSYNGTVVLESNASWFWDGRWEDVSGKFRELLNNECVACCQFSSHKLYYPNYEKFVSYMAKMRKFHPKVNAVIDWQGEKTNLVRLGRAKTLLKPDEVVGNPSCSPLVSRMLQFNSYSSLDSSYTAFMRSLFIHGYYCKPMVYVPNGNVYFGESIFCKPVDNIYNHINLPENEQQQSIKDWWEKMKKGYTFCNACNACKNIDPSMVKLLNKFFNSHFNEFDEKTSTNNFKQIHNSNNFES